MCIIVYKPKRHALPSKEFMTNCFDSNPDGAGFMYRTPEGKIHISKGHMTLEALLNAIDVVNTATPLKKRDVVIHFRISTTGSVIPQNTHPFPLSNTVKDLKELEFDCERALAHNGVLRDYAKFHNKQSDMSDTMYFAKMLYGVNERFIEAVLDRHADGTSRFAYMGPKSTVIVGLKKVENGDGKGLWVSNDGYLPRLPAPAYYNYRSGGDDDFWYGWAKSVQTRHPTNTSTGMAEPTADRKTFGLWTNTKTAMGYQMFKSFVRQEAWIAIEMKRIPSPISREENNFNPAYREWLASGVKFTFDEYCELLECDLATAIEDIYPLEEPAGTEPKKQPDMTEEDRKAFLSYLQGP